MDEIIQGLFLIRENFETLFYLFFLSYVSTIKTDWKSIFVSKKKKKKCIDASEYFEKNYKCTREKSIQLRYK